MRLFIIAANSLSVTLLLMSEEEEAFVVARSLIGLTSAGSAEASAGACEGGEEIG